MLKYNGIGRILFKTSIMSSQKTLGTGTLMQSLVRYSCLAMQVKVSTLLSSKNHGFDSLIPPLGIALMQGLSCAS